MSDLWADAQKPFNTSLSGVDNLRGKLGQLHALKQQHRHLHVGLSIGGWTFSKYFSVVAATREARVTFVTSAILLLEEYGFDYIDLDGEYPILGKGRGGNVHRENDRQNFVLLLREFQHQLQNRTSEPYVTLALPGTKVDVAPLDLVSIAPLVAFINAMTYDFEGSGWRWCTGHQANLYPNPESHGRTLLCPIVWSDARPFGRVVRTGRAWVVGTRGV